MVEIVLIFVVARPGPQLHVSYNVLIHVCLTMGKSFKSPGILTRKWGSKIKSLFNFIWLLSRPNNIIHLKEYSLITKFFHEHVTIFLFAFIIIYEI